MCSGIFTQKVGAVAVCAISLPQMSKINGGSKAEADRSCSTLFRHRSIGSEAVETNCKMETVVASGTGMQDVGKSVFLSTVTERNNGAVFP